MGDEKKTEDDSVTVMGLPGHPEKVGKSMSRRGGDIARKTKEAQESQGKVDLGEHGSSGRPAGGSTMRSMTGIDPQDSATEPDDGAGMNDKDSPKSDKKLRKA